MKSLTIKVGQNVVEINRRDDNSSLPESIYVHLKEGLTNDIYLEKDELLEILRAMKKLD